MWSIYVLQQPHISSFLFAFGDPQYCGCVKMGPLVLLALFPVQKSCLVEFEANPCDEADCGLVGFSLVL